MKGLLLFPQEKISIKKLPQDELLSLEQPVISPNEPATTLEISSEGVEKITSQYKETTLILLL